MGNYTVIHSHTMLSNPTYFDSTASYSDYINKAKELNMKAIAFTEHGNVFQWIKKKIACDEEKIKYIHGSEFYMTRDLNKQARETFHICLFAKNWEGVKELNQLSSKSFQGKGQKWREGQHYYYRPRISLEELMNTSENIMVTTACLASMLWRERNSQEAILYLNWMSNHSNRCFLEIQPHCIEDQISYNQQLYEWSLQYKIPLIVGTDTHVLNKEDQRLRKVLQQGKKATAEENEDGINLHFRTFQELINEFDQQNALEKKVYLEAINNTNKLADMCENWQLDFSHKYPKISDNPEKELRNRIIDGAKSRGVFDFEEDEKKLYLSRLKEEFETYKQLKMCDYIILLDEIIKFCRENNIAYSPRGSCNGALTLWAMHITDIDSIKFKLHFFRFVNPQRVSLGDVDIDMAGDKRPYVKDFLYNYPKIQGSAIITYQTLALRGAVRLVAKGLGYDLKTEDMVAKDIDEIKEEDENGNEKVITTFNNREKWQKLYPEWIELAEKAVGIIENASVHACGFVATDRNIEEEIGTFENGESKWRISQNNMKAIDAVNFVKMDFLVVDNVQIIEDACKLANIPSIKNDDLDLEDNNIWEEMKKSGLGIFQFEQSGWFALKRALDNYKFFKKNNPYITRYEIMLALNGVIRPSCNSFREDYLKGNIHNNGHEAINNYLAPTSGYCIFQEQIMQFLNLFCGYSGAESDSVRRGISKKGGTEKFVPEINKRFIENMGKVYNVDEAKASKLVKEFIQIILDASNYGFSTNHSCPYTLMGIKGAFLRHYYPLEYLTAQLNMNDGKMNKTNNIIEFIKQFTNIEIKPAKFRYSKDKYMFDKETNSIYKGIASFKGITCKSKVGEQLFNLKNNDYNNFYELLIDITEKTDIGLSKIELLIKTDFFSEFGKAKKLINMTQYFNLLFSKKAPKIETISKNIEDLNIINIISQNSILTKTTYSKFQYNSCLLEIWDYLANEDLELKDKLKIQKEILGYIDYKNDKLDKRYVLISNIDTKYTPVMDTYCLNNGKTCRCKISKKIWDRQPLQENQIIYINSMEHKFGHKKVGEIVDKKGNVKPEFEIDETKKEWWITSYSIIENIEED